MIRKLPTSNSRLPKRNAVPAFRETGPRSPRAGWQSACGILAVAALLTAASSAAAQERFAIVVAGASGGEVYAAHHEKWSADLGTAFTTTFKFPAANILVLSEHREGSLRSTSANVKALLGDLRRRVKAEDVVLLLLIGHGTFDGEDAKFNLVGPDLTAKEWKELLLAVHARTVVVNTTASSFPFLEELSQRGRVVVTATDSVAQKFATVFPEYFVHALRDPATDVDKDSRVSVWEAFAAASAAVKRHYEQRGQLSTERPLLDDDGDRVGKEADAPGEDGRFARTIYLDPGPTSLAADESRAALEKERRTLEAQIEVLKGRKAEMPADQYSAELEQLLLQLARVSRELRQRS